MSETEQLSAEVLALLESPDLRIPDGRGRHTAEICKRGHDQTVEGARNKWGKCGKCATIRSQRTYAAKKAANA